MSTDTSIRPTRVLFLNSCVNGGGAGRSFQAYLQNLDERVEAHLVAPDPGKIVPVLQNLTSVHYVPAFVERIHRSPYGWVNKIGWRWLHVVANFFGLWLAAFQIIKIIRQLKPDLIYANHMLANPVGSFVGWWTNLPVVFHARNIHVAWFGRKFYYFLAGRKCVKRIICNSLASSLLYREYTEDKVRVVYNFVDLSMFDRLTVTPRLRKELNLRPDDLVIGYIGRLLPKKGIDILLHAFSLIYEEHPNTHLCLIGENDGGMHHNLQSEYEKMTWQLGIADRTHFVGFQENVPPYVADLDVLALPSVEPESFGRVLIEAMAMGVPSVVSALGGATEVVRSGLNGLWCIPGDPVDLGQALNELLSDLELRSRFGRFGTSYVQENFSAVDQARLISDVLVDIVYPEAEAIPPTRSARLFQKQKENAERTWALSARQAKRARTLDRS